MSESNALYRVQFICHSERYEVYVREVNQGQLFGFIEIAHFVWDNHTALIVDPSHEKLKSEFADVTRTEPRPAAAHVPPTPPPPAPAGMALTELLAALEGERRTHAAASRAGLTRQETTMREPSNLGDGPDLGKAARAEHAMTEAHAAELAARRRDEEAAASVDAGVYGASFTLTAGHPQPPDEIRKTEHQYSEPQDQR
jgi:hypothetical protein